VALLSLPTAGKQVCNLSMSSRYMIRHLQATDYICRSADEVVDVGDTYKSTEYDSMGTSDPSTVIWHTSPLVIASTA
jgi:hypothetical protein